MAEYAEGYGGMKSCMPIGLKEEGHAGMTPDKFRSYIADLMTRYQLWPQVVAAGRKYQTTDDTFPEHTLMQL